MAGRFDGKQALVLGVANKRSIAWAIAERLAAEGAQLAFTYQGERIEKSVRDLAATGRQRRSSRACDVRSDDDVDRVFAEVGRGVRRRARPARALGRVRRRRGPRGTLHRHAARPLLDGGRHQRLLARRLRARGRAADGGARRRLDRDDDLPRRRAGRAALQRDGRREGDARRVDALPRVGPRAEGHPRQRDLGRAGAHARGALDRRLHDDGGDVRGARAAPPHDRRRRLRRSRRLPPLRRRRGT